MSKRKPQKQEKTEKKLPEQETADERQVRQMEELYEFTQLNIYGGTPLTEEEIMDRTGEEEEDEEEDD